MAHLPRHIIGRRHFSRVLSLQKKMSGYDDGQIVRAAGLALGVQKIHASQYSGMVLGTAQQISVNTFEALGFLNWCCYTWQKDKSFPTDVPMENRNKLKTYLPHIPVIEWEDEGRGPCPADTSEFVNLFIGRLTMNNFFLPEEWKGVNPYGKAPRDFFTDYSSEVNALHQEPFPSVEPVKVSIAEGVRKLLAALPGNYDDNVAALVKTYPSNVSGIKILKLNAVCHGLKGHDEWEPADEDAEIIDLSYGLTQLYGRQISPQEIRSQGSPKPVSAPMPELAETAH